jgi:hypothetical protein
MVRHAFLMMVSLSLACGETKVSEVRQAPTARITSHADGDVVTEGQVVVFQGSVSDADTESEDLAATWYAGDTELCAAAAPDAAGTTTCPDITIEDDFTEIRLEVRDTTNLVGTDAVTLTVTPNDAPEVAFVLPVDDSTFTLGAPISVEATISDAEDAPGDLSLSLTSGDGPVDFDPDVDSDGTVTGTIELPEGTHTLTLTVTDTGGKYNNDVVTITVSTTAPVVTFVKPEEDDTFAVDEVIAVEATVTDDDDAATDLTFTLESSADGDLGFMPDVDSDGNVLGSTTLSEGEHTLTLTATDPAGNTGSDVVRVTVDPSNTAPSCAITSPEDGTSGEFGVLVAIAGTVSDPDQTANTLGVEWTSDWDDSLGTSTPDTDGTVELSTSALTVNTHRLTISVTDDEGALCTDSVTYTVGQAPTVTIVQPETGDSFGPDTVITFEGTVSDTEDLPTALTVLWESDLDGVLSADPADASGTTQFTLNTTDDELTVGTHTVTLAATDTDGLTVSDLVTITVTDNNVPVVSDVTIDPDPAVVSDTLVCSYAFADADGEADSSTVSWSIDGVDVGTGASLSGVFASGDTVTCTVTPYDGIDTGVPVSASITIDNSVPSVADVTIEPDPADIDSTLTCSWTFDDADGDTDASTVSWTVDGTEVGTDPTLSGAFTGGDTVTCTVTPYDDTETGTPASASITIGNTAPTVTDVSISPDPASTTHTLTCSWTFDDADGDGDASTVSWTIGGTEVGTDSTLSGAFGVGDTVTCTVTSFDGTDSGTSDSASVTIDNTTPEVSAVSISPASPVATDVLTCSWTFTDADGDTDASTVSWTIDGSEVGTDTTLSGVFSSGDDVTCTVTAYDGTDTGTSDSDTVTITNNPPSIVAVVITPDPAYADDELTCAWIGYSDPEGDPDETVPDWYIGGTFAASGETLSGGFAKGDVVTCSVVPFDGADYGSGMSASTTIINRAPEVTSVEISPAAPNTDDDLVAVVTTFDVDGDAVDLDYVWTQDGSTSSASVSDTVAYSDTARDQEWSVTVTPDDTEDAGDAVTSGPVVISNTEPTTPVVAIAPSSPVTETDDLYCEVLTDSSDADGDSVSYAFTWTVDGAAYAGTTVETAHAGDTIPVASTDYLETWVCTATPSDGSLEGASASDSVITSCEVLTWYADTDGDGYGDDLDTIDQCDEPSGYVAVGGDCVPDDATLVDCPSDGDSDWTRVDGTEPVAWSAVGLDTTNDRILVYGGQTYHALSSEVFAFDMTSESWDIATSVSGADPGSRRGHASIFVEGTDYAELVVFGGEDYHTLTDEVFVLDAWVPGAETWADLTTAPPPGSDWPEPRTGASMIYDPEDDVALMWGGRGYYGLLGDMWELDFSGSSASWVELAPAGDIPERAFSAAVYDASHDAVYAFGGEEYHTLAETVLCMDMETLTWSEVTPSGDPVAPLTDAAVVYSPDYRAMVLYGGQGYHALPDQAYYIEPTGVCEITVTALEPGDGSSPGGLAGAGIVWDSIDDVAMLVGGQTYYQLSDSIFSLVP